MAVNLSTMRVKNLFKRKFLTKLILASFALLTINVPSYGAMTGAQKLNSNKNACKQILNKSIVFEARRAEIPKDDFLKLRMVYRSQALYIDSFYYKTFGSVASAMATLRDNIWQVADRSADMNRVQNTTQDEREIADLQYAIDTSMSYISFDIVNFASACRTLKNFKFDKNIFTYESLNILGNLAESFNCLNYLKSLEPAPFAQEWGSCTFESTVVKLYNFKSRQDLQSFLSTIAAFGITEEVLIIRGTRIIAPDDASKIIVINSLIDS